MPSHGICIFSAIAVSVSPEIPPKHSKESQRCHESPLFGKLLLTFGSLVLKEKMCPVCYCFPLNSSSEAQCHVREGSTKTGWSCLLVKGAPGADSVALCTHMATENPWLSFHMTPSDYLHVQHSSNQHWHLQHWNGTLWKPWHWTQTFRRALPLWTTQNAVLNSSCNQWCLKSIFGSEHCSTACESVCY